MELFISVEVLTSFILMFWTLDQETPEAGGLPSLWAGKEEVRLLAYPFSSHRFGTFVPFLTTCAPRAG